MQQTIFLSSENSGISRHQTAMIFYIVFLRKQKTQQNQVEICLLSRRFLKFLNIILTFRTLNWKVKTSLMMDVMANMKNTQKRKMWKRQNKNVPEYLMSALQI